MPPIVIPAQQFVVTVPPQRTVTVTTQGPQGESPRISVYDQTGVTAVARNLVLDLTFATTFFVNLVADVVSITIINAPANRSQRVAIYFKQDATGGHTVNGWPSECRWPMGLEPPLSPHANAVDLVVVDAVVGLFFGALVALDYR